MSRLDKLLKILAVEPNDAFTLYGLAQEYAKIGDAANAIAYFDRCLTADPNYCYAYYHKAKTQAEDGNEPAAAATLKEGMSIAKRLSDSKALSEMQTLLDSFE